MIDFQLYCGDVREAMVAMADNSIDAVFCDPPYGLGKTPDMTDLLHHWLSDVDYQFGKGFMGKDWDIVPGPAVWKELYRVAKPGAYLFAFGGTRTADLLSIAIRLAGWERFDEIAYYHGGMGDVDWCYGSGFPKSHDISKAIDKAAGAERKVIGVHDSRSDYDGKQRASPAMNNGWREKEGRGDIYDLSQKYITAPATAEAATWAGYGTALKPAREPILCFRKPVDKTYANNALKWGTGGLNIDATRVPIDDGATMARNNKPGDNGWKNSSGGANNAALYGEPNGRWPANVLHDGSDAIKAEFDKAGATGGKWGKQSKEGTKGMFGVSVQASTTEPFIGDTGSAARFFAVCPPDNPPFVYGAKASRSERNAGLDGMEGRDRDDHNLTSNACGRCGLRVKANGSGKKCECGDLRQTIKLSTNANHHPCVKPLSLCRYIASLILPPETYRDTATILIPYAGSGSEVIGATQAGWRNIIGIERDAEYCEIGRRRFAYWQARQAEKETLTVIAAESPVLLREQGGTHASE